VARLGVNIDHIATLREARKTKEPLPLAGALICEKAGADSIVAHLREDRRHIKEKDLFLLRRKIRTRLNLEMSTARDVVSVACKVKPDRATLVPEKRKELTTEGGLDVVSNSARIKEVFRKLDKNGIEVSLFIDPDKRQIDRAAILGISFIELHTGRYANAQSSQEQKKFLVQIRQAAEYARQKGIRVSAGHGLDYRNIAAISKLKMLGEFNIGYSIICYALFVGLEQAVRKMKLLVR